MDTTYIPDHASHQFCDDLDRGGCPRCLYCDCRPSGPAAKIVCRHAPDPATQVTAMWSTYVAGCGTDTVPSIHNFAAWILQCHAPDAYRERFFPGARMVCQNRLPVS